MNVLDLVVVLAMVVAVVGGWRLGLITRALGWVGAALGVAVGISLVPALSRWLSPSTDAGVVLLTAGSFILLVSIGQAIGVAIGSRLRPAVHEEGLRRVDAAGGSVLGAVGVVVIVWLLLPLLAGTEGWVSATTRSSVIARGVTDLLPPPPDSVARLERDLANGNFPQLFAGLRPAPELPAPPEGSPVGPEVLEAALASTARLQGTACGFVQSGSGFSVGDGLWVTNAHVVAGTGGTTLSTPDGATGTGRVVAFDPRTDLAVVRSDDLRRPALPLGESSEGDQGLVLGYPGGGSIEPSPYLVGEMLTATGYDIYDRDLVRRELLILASDLEPGDSGSALIDADGRVVGAAVAVAPDRPGVAYALGSQSVGGLVSVAGADAVGTGECLR